MNPSECLNQQQLLAYLQGSLTEEEAQGVEDHLSICDTCEAELRTHDGLSDALFAAFREIEGDMEQFTSESGFRQAAEAIKNIPASESRENRPRGSGPAQDAAQASLAVANPPPQPTMAAASPSLPRMIDEYQLLQRIGSGGMGTVYKARHTKLNKIVAVKMMRESRLDDPTAAARFDREMLAVGVLDHPNVVRATDARVVDGQRLLVMEYVEGIDSAMLVRRTGPLLIADACEIVRQAALGLQSAHDLGLVHRDIKPSNVMVAMSGQVKVLDLGLALVRELAPSQEEVTASDQALGTAEYTAPEQISSSHNVDRRADIYSLGCTFFKLLTGRSPFEGPQYPTREMKLAAHLLNGLPDVRKFRPELPEELVEMLARMTAKPPSVRYSSMRELSDQLLKFCSGHNLPRLVERAASGRGPAAAEVAKSANAESRSSAMASTGDSERPEPTHVAPRGAAESTHIAPRDESPRAGVAPQDSDQLAPQDARAGRKWHWALMLLGAVLAIVSIAATIAAVTDCGTLEIKTLDKDVRVVVSRNGGDAQVVDTRNGKQVVLRSGDYELKLADGMEGVALSSHGFNLRRGDRVVIEVVNSPPGESPVVAAKDQLPPKPEPPPPTDTVALKDFFKDVPGHWVPMLRSEKNLEQLGPRDPASVLFKSGVVEVKGRYVSFPSISNAIQGIRAKVKWDVGYAQLTLREGPEGHVLAFFQADGSMWSGATYEENGKRLFMDMPTKTRYRTERSGDFVPIGFAAIGSRYRFECNGSSREYVDKRLVFGSPGFGTKISRPAGHAWFKDVEVFVPDKDADAASPLPANTADRFVNGIGATFVRIKPGKFSMGSPPSEAARLDGESRHDVRISKPFFISTCEITQGQYQAVSGENPSSFAAKGKNGNLVSGKDTSRYPVECVSWDDAQKFCEKLSAREQRRYRLPTEAEWEYCCRAEMETAYYFGTGIDSNKVDSSQVYRGPLRVGLFPENRWGLCDMHGNVAEWCQDYYSPTYYQESPATDPAGPATGTDRVIRGGSWATPAVHCRCAARSFSPPSTRRDDLGFRVVTE